MAWALPFFFAKFASSLMKYKRRRVFIMKLNNMIKVAIVLVIGAIVAMTLWMVWTAMDSLTQYLSVFGIALVGSVMLIEYREEIFKWVES